MTMATAPAMGQNTAPAMGQNAAPAMDSILAQCLVPNSVPPMGPMVPDISQNAASGMNSRMAPHLGPNTLPALDPEGIGSWEPGHLPPMPAPSPQKTPASNLSEVDRGRIVGMWEAGRKPTAIATAIPCSKRTACKWINAYRNCGKEGLVDLRRSGLAGRPRKTTEDENLAIIKAMDENHSRAATSTALAALKLRVSDRTIRRRLQEARAERRKRAAAHSSHSSKVNSVKSKSKTKSKAKKKKKSETSNPVHASSTLPSVPQPSQNHLLAEHDAMTFVEVRMDTHSLPDSGPCCYVNL